jgi:dTDP-4-amino-4,6-dideoxygalactose transaminase
MLICPPVDGAVVVSPFGAAFNEHDYHNLGIPLVFDLCGAFPMILSTKYPRVYSTHATKNISTREGGIAVFQDPYLAGVARCLTNFSIREDRSPFTIFGGNHKMDEHRCGMLLDYDMKHIARKIEKKRNALEQYSKVATPLPGLIEGYPSLCVLKVDNPDALIAEGGRNDIIFKKYYYPLLSDVDFREKPRTACVTPNEELRKYVAFPSDVTNCQIAEVCELVKRVNNEKLSNI